MITISRPCVLLVLGGAVSLWVTVAGSVAAEPASRAAHPVSVATVEGSSSTAPRMAGQVLDAQQQPIVGAALALHALTPDSPWLAPVDQPVARAKADAAGRFGLRAPTVGMWQVRASAPGYATARIDLVPLVHDQTLSQIVLRPVRIAAVEVVDPEGVPVRGATVLLDPRPNTRVSTAAAKQARAWAEPQQATTDQAGRAELRAPAGSTHSLQVRAAGFLPWSAPRKGQPAKGQAVTRVVLKRVALQPEAVDGLQAGDGARRPSAEAIARPAVFGPASGSRTPERGAVSGRVVSSDGHRPVAQAVVWHADDPASFALTDGEGRFHLRHEDRPDDRWPADHAAPHDWSGAREHRPDADRLRVAAWGYLPTSVPLRVRQVNARPASPVSRIVLRPGIHLQGIVVDAAGHSVADAVVSVHGEKAEWVRARSAGDGTFTLPPVPFGRPLQLQARHSGFVPAWRSVSATRTATHGGDAAMRGLRLRLERGRTAHGVVRDEIERPVAGAAITLSSVRTGAVAGESGVGGERLHAESDENGKFVLVGVRPGRFDLSARASGLAPVTVPGIVINRATGDTSAAKESTSSVDLGTVLLGPGARIAGQVLDAAGQPVAEAGLWYRSLEDPSEMHRPAARGSAGLVSTGLASDELESVGGGGRAGAQIQAVAPPAAWSDADGRFVIDDLTPGQRVSLSVTREGYAEARLDPIAAPASGLEIVLEAAMMIRGVVRDELGHAIPEAHLHLAPASSGSAKEGAGRLTVGPARFATSDASGTFAIEGVTTGEWTLRARAQGYQDGEPLQVRAAVGEAREPLSVVLVPGASVVGQVLDGDGRPVPEARVSSVAAAEGVVGTSESVLRSATTDAEGRYRLDGLPMGAATLAAEHAEHPRAAKEVDVRPGDNQLDFELEPGWTIAGVVLDMADRPVGGARVVARTPGESVAGSAHGTKRSSGTGVAVASADGSFEIAVGSEGNYLVRAEKPGYAEQRTGPQAEDLVSIRGQSTHGVVLRLAAGGVITGQVSGLTFDELSRARVMAFAGDRSSKPRSVTLDYEARYRFDGLPPGEWVVYAGLRDSGRSAKESIRLSPGDTEVVLDLQLGDGLVLSGQILRASQPVASAQVRASAQGTFGGARTVAGQDGRFRLEGLEPGAYQLVVHDGAESPEHVRDVHLETDQDLLVELEALALDGEVVGDRDGSAIPDAVVTLTAADRADAGQPIVRRTDRHGRFRFAGLASGRYRVRARGEGYGNRAQVIDVDDRTGGQRVELRLAPSEALTLDVRHPTGRVAGEVGVVVLDAQDQIVLDRWLSPGADGLIRLDDLPAGRWTLLASGRGTATTRQIVEVPGGPVAVHLPETGQLSVLVPDLAGAGRTARLVLSDVAGRAYFDVAVRTNQWMVHNGAATVPSVPVGTWVVTVRALEEPATWTTTSRVGPGQATVVDLH